MGRLACKVVELVMQEYENQEMELWELDEDEFERGVEE
jgi:hypothetical protein